MHHSCFCIRIFVYSMAIKNMKRIAEITFCFIVLPGMQVLLHNQAPGQNRNNQLFTEITCSGIILQDNLNSLFADDNEMEMKSQSRLVVTGEQPAINCTQDIFSSPKQHCFLNPLFSDRPPPSICQ